MANQVLPGWSITGEEKPYIKAVQPSWKK